MLYRQEKIVLKDERILVKEGVAKGVENAAAGFVDMIKA